MFEDEHYHIRHQSNCNLTLGKPPSGRPFRGPEGWPQSSLAAGGSFWRVPPARERPHALPPAAERRDGAQLSPIKECK